jgi:hypothetical protein
MLHVMYDAAYPPTRPYPGATAVAGYIGGNTPHVWTSSEWNAANGGGRLHQLPIWVGYLEDNPEIHANEAVKAAEKLGWASHLLHRRYICLDKETQQDRAWCARFASVLHRGGFDCLEYRSVSTIESDPTPSQCDNWAADWYTKVNWNLVPRTEAFQFAPDVHFDTTMVDLSLVSDQCLTKLGTGLRH